MSFIVKNTTLLNPLDLLMPHSCRGCGRLGEVLCDCCKNNIAKQHGSFKTQAKSFPRVYFVGERTNLLDQLIHEYKYSEKRALAKPLAELLNHALPNLPEITIIVPLPTISKHIRERGFDHTLKIAKHLHKLHPNWPVQHLLLRDNQSVQVGASKKERQAQAKSAYLINPKIPVQKAATYLLIDDVWTTGSSMHAAYKKLRQAGVSKIVISVLAVSRLNQ